MTQGSAQNLEALPRQLTQLDDRIGSHASARIAARELRQHFADAGCRIEQRLEVLRLVCEQKAALPGFRIDQQLHVAREELLPLLDLCYAGAHLVQARVALLEQRIQAQQQPGEQQDGQPDLEDISQDHSGVMPEIRIVRLVLQVLAYPADGIDVCLVASYDASLL